MSWTKIRTKLWFVLGASDFKCMPQMRQFYLFTYPPRSKLASSENMIFFSPKSTSSVSRSQAHLAKRKLIEWSIGFNFWINWTLYGVIPRSLCKIRLNDVSEMFKCWEQWWIDVDGASYTLSATTAIFSGVRTVLCFSRFGLSMRMPVSFPFFHKITNIRSWRVLLFYQNPVRNYRIHSATLRQWLSK